MGQIISSLQNPAVKNVLLLLAKPRERKQQDLIVIEGTREVRLALVSGFSLTALFYCREFITGYEAEELFSQSVKPYAISEVTSEVFNRMAYRKDSGGVIALAKPKRLLFQDLKLRACPLILVLESVEKPGNLGAVLRTADAANLDAVIICDPQTDIYNPNAIRSSLGTLFTIPVVTSTTENTINWLNSKEISIFCTTPSATQYYHQMKTKNCYD